MRAIRATLAVLAVAVLGLVMVRLLSPPAHAQAGPPWNVVVIMVDDLDVGLLETALATDDPPFMPNFKTFLSEVGKTFSNAFVSYSLCCPSRATFLTGQYAHNHGVKNNNGDDGGCAAFNDDETVARWLQLATPSSYHTGFIGKYLNGYGSNDQEEITHCFNPEHVPDGWNDWQALVGAQNMWGYRINDNGELSEPFNGASNYQTTMLAAAAAEFIELAPLDEPFFLSVNPTAPHIEATQELCEDNWFDFDGEAHTIRVPPAYADDAEELTLPQGESFNELDVDDKPAPLGTQIPLMNQQTPGHITCTQDVWQDRLESLILVDQLIGTIATALTNREGALDNTVVIFTSDNGYYHGEHRLHKKVFPYEEGIRVPLVIRYPDSLEEQTFDEFVVNTDLAPTIAALAGVSPPSGFVDGRSLLQMLQGQEPSTWRKRFLIEHWNAPATDPIPTFFGIRTADTDTTLLTPNALYMEYFHPTTPTEFEYYKLDDDPNQMENLCYKEDEDLEECDDEEEEEAPTAFPERLTALRNCSGNEPPTSCFSLEN